MGDSDHSIPYTVPEHMSCIISIYFEINFFLFMVLLHFRLLNILFQFEGIKCEDPEEY